MKNVIDRISKEFNSQYFPSLNSFWEKQTRKWDYWFGKEELKESFYRGVMYVITQFLEDTDHTELFLRIPFNELGRSPQEQTDNFNRLLEIVSHCLHMATVEANIKSITAPTLEDCKEEEWYFTDRRVRIPVQRSAERERIWRIVKRRDGVSIRPQEAYHDGNQCLRTPDAVNMFNDCLADTIRLKGDPGNSNKTTRSRLSGYHKYYKKVQSMKLSTQYDNALIVSFSADWRKMGIPICDDTFYDVVDFTNNYVNLYGTPYDIMVFVGDNKYNNVAQLINNMDNTKKVIYIGSEYEDFKKKENAEGSKSVHFSFTFRESFTYFNGPFPVIDVPKLNADWLLGLLNNLLEKLQSYGTLQDNDCKNIVTVAAFPMLNMDFNSIKSNNADRLEDYIFENYSSLLTQEQIAEIISLYESFAIEGKSSKLKAYESIKCQVPNKHKELLIPNHYSYHNIIKRHIKTGNRSGNHLTVDVKGDWQKFVDVVKYMLKMGAMGTYHFLSYTELKNLKNFFADETTTYNSPYRMKILGGLKFRCDFSAEVDSVVDSGKTLTDYYHPIILDQLMQEQWNRSFEATRYCLKCEDEKTIYTSGNLIYNDHLVGIDDLFEDQKSYLPANITYYENPANFRDIMRVYHNFPSGKDIEYYSKLWKNILKDYCDKVYHGNYKEMRKKDFPFLPASQIAHYVDNGTMFPNKLYRLALKFENLKLLSSDEFKNLIAAFTASKTFSKLGSELKDSLYNYKLTGEKTQFLTNIEQNARSQGINITADSMMSDSIKEIRVINIEEITKKNEN